MEVKVTGRHMGVSDALKSYCIEKAHKVERFYNRIQSIEVVLDGKAGVHEAEMIIHMDGNPPIVAHERQEDAFAAIHLVVDKIEEQLRRLKERLRNRKHPRGAGEEEALA